MFSSDGRVNGLPFSKKNERFFLPYAMSGIA